MSVHPTIKEKNEHLNNNVVLLEKADNGIWPFFLVISFKMQTKLQLLPILNLWPEQIAFLCKLSM